MSPKRLFLEWLIVFCGLLASCAALGPGVDKVLIEVEIAQEPLATSPLFSSRHNYSQVLSSLALSSEQKATLRQIQTELIEKFFLLQMRQQRINQLLSRSLLAKDPPWPRVRYLINLLSQVTLDENKNKVLAALKAKRVIHEGLTAEQLESVKSAQSAAFMAF